MDCPVHKAACLSTCHERNQKKLLEGQTTFGYGCDGCGCTLDYGERPNLWMFCLNCDPYKWIAKLASAPWLRDFVARMGASKEAKEEELDTCPNCSVNLQNDPIPERLRHNDECGGVENGCFDHPYPKEPAHYSRRVGVEIHGVYDGLLYWSCPDCKWAWHRWEEGTEHHALAAEFVQADQKRASEVICER